MPAESNGHQANDAPPTDLVSNYGQSGFSSQSPTARALPFGPHPALLIIDVCNAYLTPGSPLYAPDRFDAALKHTESLIELFRSTPYPVIFTKVVYPSPASGGVWYKYKIPKALASFDAGNPLGDFPKQSTICQPKHGELVLEKQYSSCFFGTSLSSMLMGLEVDTLVICGYSTSGCVRATSVDAIQYGFKPFIVREACGDRHSYVHEANLFDIQAKFGEVVSMDEIKGMVAGLPKKSS